MRALQMPHGLLPGNNRDPRTSLLPTWKYILYPALFILLQLYTLSLSAQSGRVEKDLSVQPWYIWPDTAAAWKNDVLYAPPVNIASLPVHPPSIGWDGLHQKKEYATTLPATTEQYFWGYNGNAFGVSGNYLGVSWFTTTVHIPASFRGKRVALAFASVRFRAEIFVNRKLAGYDLVSQTPFEVDITDMATYGADNEIAIRITDPNGNFDWRDSKNFMWGDYRTQPSHGFGGITGPVVLRATEQSYISDVFIRNKPDPRQIEVEVSLGNAHTNPGASLSLEISETATGKVIYRNTRKVGAGSQEERFSIRCAGARLWSPDEPHLYILRTTLSHGAATDQVRHRFGFRWFEVRNNKGDQQFFLNGNRIVLRTAISWGFWPENGIAPPDSLARKQIMSAKALGLNMLNFHRGIGQTNVLDHADELGLLYFEEPGGNQYPADRYQPRDELSRMQKDFYFKCRDEKLFRMIRRDRNHPSLIIYNLHNERGAEPQEEDRQQMRAAHQLDETRILTYNSSNGAIKTGPDPRFKLHLLPYDTTFRDFGWFDQHHAGGPGVYHNALYAGPTQYLRYTDNKKEIVYYGEDGAIGTPPRLQLIRDQLRNGQGTMKSGWESKDYLDWYDAYDRFLDQQGFREAFPTVDSLTRSLGNVAYYYQGRIIENIRMNNTVDGYAINGWESMKLENHSGIVDNYRNPKGDTQVLAKYNRPAFLAVKINKKVLAAGDSAVADIFIINERNIKGRFRLEVSYQSSDQNAQPLFSREVQVTGGSTFGELLVSGIPFKVNAPGYGRLHAVLKREEDTLLDGEDEVFAVQLRTDGIPSEGMVADTSGSIGRFLRAAGLKGITDFKSGRPNGKFMITGAFEPQETGNPLVTDILEWVNEGNTLIVAGNIEAWCQFLAKKEIIDYRGAITIGASWYGGNYFSKEHTLLEGLPQACAFNWEYQSLATYNKKRTALRIENGETIVAAVADHKKEVYSALSVVPHGRGKIILCALDLLSCLQDQAQEKLKEGDGENAAQETFNRKKENSANVVGQQLLLNLMRTDN